MESENVMCVTGNAPCPMVLSSPSSVNKKCAIIFSYEFLLKVSATSIQRGKRDDDTSAEISVPAAT